MDKAKTDDARKHIPWRYLFLSVISWQEHVTFRWDDVRFILSQQAWLDFV